VLTYTGRMWGSQQRLNYKSKINSAIRSFATFPQRGTELNEVFAGLRCLPVDAHINFYRATDDSVVVIRVLHEKMDAKSQIAPYVT
jgi:toxin ParE1/3/4